MRRIIQSAFVICSIMLLFVTTTYAQEGGINLTLSPVFLNIITDPGEEASSQFRVRNNSPSAERLELKVLKFSASDDGASPLIADPEQGDDFIDWMELSPSRFTLAPNESQTIDITIDPPEDAALGYYYAVTVTRQQVEGQGAVVAGAPAISVLLNVRSDNAKRELQLVDFTTDKFFYEYLPTQFNIAVKNTGNIHVIPFGDIFIDQGGNKDIAILPANEGRGNILPQSTRTYISTWSDGFPLRVPKTEGETVITDDTGNPEYTTEWDFSKADRFRIGKYTAHLLMVYDNGERDVPLEATVSFWVIPWKIILAVLGVLFFVFLGIKSMFGGHVTRLKKVVRKEEHPEIKENKE